MNPFKFFIAGILFFSAISPVNVLAQCSNRIELVRTSPGNPGTDEGSVVVRITTTRSFEAKLIRLDEASEKIIATRQGSGSETLTFSKLSSDTFYRVHVKFEGEEKFLCRTKVLTDIVLTSRGN